MAGAEGVVVSGEPAPATRRYTTRQAAFIGVGAMVGAGIFSLLGAAGEVAGAAVWLSFAIAGAIAILQGYSFAKLGAVFPSAGGLLEYISRGFGEGRIANVTAWLVYFANNLITAMVAVSFGSYASGVLADDDARFAKVAAVAIVIAMTALNIVGSTVVARVQSVIVFVVVGILGFFSVVTIANLDPALLAPSGYPSLQHIISSVALTFFAFLGFGVITFTARDLPDPARQLPRAMYLALGIATTIYVAIAIGVFGTLPVDQVIASGATAIAVAAKPVLGDAGYSLMAVTALFATAGATNAGLYPAQGVSEHLAATGQFPPVLGRRLGGRASVGLLLAAALILALIIPFDLSSIASIGSAVALMIFMLVTIAHLRVRAQTGANVWVLVLGLATTGVTLVTFVFTSLIQEPASVATLVAILVLSLVIDIWVDPDPRPAASGGRVRPAAVRAVPR